MIPLHLPPGDTSIERTLQIDGTSEQIDNAKQLVNEVISEVCVIYVVNVASSNSLFMLCIFFNSTSSKKTACLIFSKYFSKFLFPSYWG